MSKLGWPIIPYTLFFALMGLFVIAGLSPKKTLLITGDSVGLRTYFEGKDTLLKSLQGSFEVTNQSALGSTAVVAYRRLTASGVEPDAILLFAGACDRVPWGMSDESIEKQVRKFKVRYPDATVIWIDTARTPVEWQYDGTHLTVAGYQSLTTEVNSLLYDGSASTDSEWLTLVDKES